jgi:uncharacterized protein YqgV (UPF0045/DUF77 family)
MVMATNIKVEFTIEPWVDGDPPERVNKCIEAIETLGISVELGPFGTTFVATADLAGSAVSALISTAYAHGATHVSIDVEKVD